MFLRFVVGETDDTSKVAAGVFVAAYQLRDSGHLSEYEQEHLKGLLSWFEGNLQEPTRFRRSRYPRGEDKGVAWFKPSARTYLAKIHELIHILEANDVHVRILKTKRPGYVVYEDDHQIVAEPFTDLKL